MEGNKIALGLVLGLTLLLSVAWCLVTLYDGLNQFHDGLGNMAIACLVLFILFRQPERR